MFEKIKNLIIKLWSKIKLPLLNATLKKLDALKEPLAKTIAEHEGTPEQQADSIIEWIKNYLRGEIL